MFFFKYTHTHKSKFILPAEDNFLAIYWQPNSFARHFSKMKIQLKTIRM